MSPQVGGGSRGAEGLTANRFLWTRTRNAHTRVRRAPRQSNWQVRTLDSVKLLGPRKGPIAEKAFARLVKVPGLYDGLHFAHLRTGSKLAELMDRTSRASLEPALRTELEREPADLIWSVFSTGASAAAKVSFADPFCRSVVLCTDVAVHRLWVSPGTDLFMVTSPAAAASVRRYLPRARVAIVHPPVRNEFYSAPSQKSARATLGIADSEPCVLMIDSGWGFAPFAESAAALAHAGVRVLCVAGRNSRPRAPIKDRGRGDVRHRAVRIHHSGADTHGCCRPRRHVARSDDVQRSSRHRATVAVARRHAGPRARQSIPRTRTDRRARVLLHS